MSNYYHTEIESGADPLTATLNARFSSLSGEVGSLRQQVNDFITNNGLGEKLEMSTNYHTDIEVAELANAGVINQRLGDLDQAIYYAYLALSRINIFDPSLAGAVPPADYYVDSQAGDDANSGNSENAPYRTLLALPNPIPASTTIALNRGSRYRGGIYSNNDGVSVIAYGVGPRPLVDCSLVFDNDDWVKTSGQTNIYEQQVTVEANNTAHINVWNGGVFMKIVSDLGVLDATPNAYYVDDHTSGTPIIYIHPANSQDPTLGSAIYEYAHRLIGVELLGEHCKVLSIHTEKPRSNHGSIEVGNYGYVYDCVANYGGKHNMYAGGGSKILDCYMTDAYYSAPNSMLVVFNEVGNDADTLIERVEFTNTRPDFYECTATNAHTGTSGKLGIHTISDCVFTNMDKVVGTLRDVDSLVFKNHTMTNCGTVLGNVAHIGGEVSNIVSTGQTSRFFRTAEHTVPQWTFDRLYICATVDCDAVFLLDEYASVQIENCHMGYNVSSGGTRRFVSVTGSAGATVVFNNNTMQNGIRYLYFNHPVAYTGNGNCFAEDNPKFRHDGVDITGLANWQLASGQDAGSTADVDCDVSQIPTC